MKKIILLLLLLFPISFVTYSSEIIKTFTVHKNKINKAFLSSFIENKNDSLFYHDIEIFAVDNILRLKNGLQPNRLIKNTENLLKREFVKTGDYQYEVTSKGTFMVYPKYYETINFFKADSITFFFKFKIKNNNLTYKLIGLNFFYDKTQKDSISYFFKNIFYYAGDLKINENILISDCTINMQLNKLTPVMYEKSTIYYSDFELKDFFSFNYYDNNTFELSDLGFMIYFENKFGLKNIQFTPKANKKFVKIPISF